MNGWRSDGESYEVSAKTAPYQVIIHRYVMNISALQNKMVSTLTIASLGFLLLFAPLSRGGQPARLDETIEHLIAYVANSDLIFVRNSEKHTGKEAAEHMRKKYAHFRGKIDTPEDFIELCASQSLLTRKPYLVINEKGETVSTKEWLSTELALYRNSVPDEPH